MNPLMKKLAVIVLGSSLLGSSIPIGARSNKELAAVAAFCVSSGIALGATALATVKSFQAALEKDEEKQAATMQSAEKAMFIGLAGSIATLISVVACFRTIT